MKQKHSARKSPTHKSARLIIADSESSSDLIWASGFFVPDPVIFLDTGSKRYLAVSDLEYARALKEARVSQVFSYHELAERFSGTGRPRLKDYLLILLKDLKIHSLTVPETFPAFWYEQLTQEGLKVSVQPDPFYPKRAFKTTEEKHAIQTAIRATEKAILKAKSVLQNSKIQKGFIVYGGKRLTSESLRYVIDSHLLEAGYLARDTIVAGGAQGADPHCRGTGPLRAHQPIVIDVFPRSTKTGYHADITRTFVKGQASDTVKRMHRAVRAGQEAAFKLIKHNVNARIVHQAVCAAIENHHFKTERIDGVLQGFIHSTGHGLGLDVHEWPRVSSLDEKLKTGHVVTVEPGLYYPEHGGIRIEDDVFVTQTGCEVLSKIPRGLEVS